MKALYMPQLQNMVINDRETTPVAHTFIPRDIVNGVATVEESTGVPIGNSSMSTSLRKTASGAYKITMKYRFPIVQTQTVNGISAPVVVRTSYVELTFSFDATSTEQERKNTVGLVANSLASSVTLTNDLLTKLQNVY